MNYFEFMGYRQRIIFDEEKKYFDEIFKLFSRKLYRSAYIMAWIMIVEALRHRILILADSGEKNAIKIISEIENFEKQKHSADKEIIEGAKSLSLVDEEDICYLEAFWLKRCIFVHPYSKQPTKAEVESILKLGVDKIFSNSAFYRKSFIDNEIQNLKIIHYLPNDSKIIKEQINKVLGRITPSLYPYFFKSILSEIGEIINEHGKEEILRKYAIYLQEIYCTASLENIRNHFRIEYYIIHFPNELIFGLVNDKIWETFDIDLKKKIIHYISENIRLENYYLKSNQKIIKMIVNNKIEPSECQGLIDLLESLPFFKLYSFVPVSNIIVKSIIIQLETYNFQIVDSVIFYISNIQYDQYSHVDDLLLLKVGKLILFNALNNSWASQSFIKTINSKKNKLPAQIMYGMLFGQFYLYDMNLNVNFTYFDYIIEYFNNSNFQSDYFHWFEVYKNIIGKTFVNGKKALDEYIIDAERIGLIDSDNLIKIQRALLNKS